MPDHQYINSKDDLENELLLMMSVATEDIKNSEITWTKKASYGELNVMLLIKVIANASSTAISLEDFVNNLDDVIWDSQSGSYENYVKETSKGRTMSCKINIKALAHEEAE